MSHYVIYTSLLLCYLLNFIDDIMPQDCIADMRKTHTVPATVKAANLARWFPPWKVSLEQWSTIPRSSVSGVAADAMLFSRIGVPLIHRYRVFSRAGTHVAFHGTYMAKLRTFS